LGRFVAGVGFETHLIKSGSEDAAEIRGN
jgi:hypothetical protein